MELVYYSYKKIAPGGPGSVRHDFAMPLNDQGQLAGTVLGEHDGRVYISMAKDVDIGQQDPEIQVQKHTELPEDVKLALSTVGEHVTALNETQSLSELKYLNQLDGPVSRELAAIRTDMRGIAELLAMLVQSSPALMDERSRAFGSNALALAILNKLNKGSQNVGTQMGKVGL